MSTTKSTLQTDKGWVVLSLTLVCVVMAEPASATVLDNFGATLLNILNSTFLRAIAIMALVGTGIMALSGRIEWSKFLVVLLAIVIVFGAGGIVDYIQANATTASVSAYPAWIASAA